MDLYLPDEFYALSELPNTRREELREELQWLGGEAYVAPLTIAERVEPDPIWRVI